MIEAVDLFCGAGGLTAGLLKAEINVKAGYDIDPACAYPYEKNNTGASYIQRDVQVVTGQELLQHYSPGAIKLLAGCAPCQPFSTYNHGKDVRNHQKWPLLYSFSRLIRELNPELVTMENVPHVIRHSVYRDFVKNLEDQGYLVNAQEVLCADYGIPQMRRRHVLLASRIGRVQLIPPTHATNHPTVRHAISSLPVIEAGGYCKEDVLHRSASLNHLNLERIKASRPGGTWEDWPKELRAACHRRPSGKTFNHVYARMEWDKPAPTMTTQCYGFGNGRFGHPEQNRAISLREAAIIQSFPTDYKFFDQDKHKPNMSAIGRMIGNAVPVRLGEVVGLSFKQLLTS